MVKHKSRLNEFMPSYREHKNQSEQNYKINQKLKLLYNYNKERDFKLLKNVEFNNIKPCYFKKKKLIQGLDLILEKSRKPLGELSPEEQKLYMALCNVFKNPYSLRDFFHADDELYKSVINTMDDVLKNSSPLEHSRKTKLNKN